MKMVLIFIVLFLTMAINLPHGMIMRLGFDADILIAVLVAVVLAGLLRNSQLFLVFLVVICMVAANLPGEMLIEYGIDPDYFLGILIALSLFPIGNKLFGK
ncbi:MAG: hypothetical protein OEZ15_07460 [Gammaproteobacteria bacterium]|nr:hypothetical protein [Gammaproteobacteria bacterium]